MATVSVAWETINYIGKVNKMRSAKKVSAARESMRHLWGVFLDWLYMTILLIGGMAILLLGAICVASSANAWRMTGYLDVLFGLYTIGTVYILIWLPVAVLVYYNRYE